MALLHHTEYNTRAASLLPLTIFSDQRQGNMRYKVFIIDNRIGGTVESTSLVAYYSEFLIEFSETYELARPNTRKSLENLAFFLRSQRHKR